MIENQEQLLLSQQQLEKLQSMEKRTSNDVTEDFRIRESKLAGIRGMVDQIEKEIRIYHLIRFQESLEELQVRSQKIPPEDLPELVSQMLGAMQEFTTAMRPII